MNQDDENFFEEIRKTVSKAEDFSIDQIIKLASYSKLDLQDNNINNIIPLETIVELRFNNHKIHDTHLLRYSFAHVDEVQFDPIPLSTIVKYHVSDAPINTEDVPLIQLKDIRTIEIHPYHLYQYSANDLLQNQFQPLTASQLLELKNSNLFENPPTSFKSHIAKLPIEETRSIYILTLPDIKELTQKREWIDPSHILLFNIAQLKEAGLGPPAISFDYLKQVDRENKLKYDISHLLVFSKTQLGLSSIKKHMNINVSTLSEEIRKLIHVSHSGFIAPTPGSDTPGSDTPRSDTPRSDTSGSTVPDKFQIGLSHTKLPTSLDQLKHPLPTQMKTFIDLRNYASAMKRFYMFTHHANKDFEKTVFLVPSNDNIQTIFYPIPVDDHSPFLQAIYPCLSFLTTLPTNLVYSSIKLYHIEAILNKTLKPNRQQWFNFIKDDKINNRKRKIMYTEQEPLVKMRPVKISAREEAKKEESMEEQ